MIGRLVRSISVGARRPHSNRTLLGEELDCPRHHPPGPPLAYDFCPSSNHPGIPLSVGVRIRHPKLRSTLCTAMPYLQERWPMSI